jgi:MFS family permease
VSSAGVGERAITAPRPGLRRVLTVLCLTEITSWGVLYYAFPVLADQITSETGWSRVTITAAFSSALVVSAGVGIPVGRRLDRVGPRALMTAGSLLAVVAVIVVALAQNLAWFFAGWLIAGISMAGTLYPPAFAALTRWSGAARVSALTTLTLVAGLASTVFAPLAAALMGHLGWRQTYLVLAAVLAVVTIPAHAFGLNLPWPQVTPLPAGETHRAPAGADPAAVARSRTFVVLSIAITLAAFGFYAGVINLVPLLLARGLSESTAAAALGLGGAGQVVGRLGYGRLTRRTGLRTRTVAVLLAGAVTTVALALLPGPASLLIVGAVLAGCARGIFTLLSATAVSDRWGIHHYGRLNGLLSAPMTLAIAVAPAAGAGLAALVNGYPEMFLILAAAGVLATLLAAAVTPARLP